MPAFQLYLRTLLKTAFENASLDPEPIVSRVAQLWKKADYGTCTELRTNEILAIDHVQAQQDEASARDNEADEMSFEDHLNLILSPPTAEERMAWKN
ncbi:hypothetical protein Pan44_25130 [Caulifigura coniformis]|uniref:Uncharacterized protein n=1 Tax=Caulifigura coniformis TaxID=2527983 RepID=A0A517SEC3_9PLAN|nr:hypothetical protein [Caulifigura coniformis]QDT54480.1 hypothetical protein Pan44_25130 [Caulifigura coniformis]